MKDVNVREIINAAGHTIIDRWWSPDSHQLHGMNQDVTIDSTERYNLVSFESATSSYVSSSIRSLQPRRQNNPSPGKGQLLNGIDAIGRACHWALIGMLDSLVEVLVVFGSRKRGRSPSCI